MNMLAFYQRLSLGLLLLSSGLSAQAQVTRSTGQAAADSSTHTPSRRADYYPVQLNFISGKQLRGYMESYTTTVVGQLLCYEVPPDSSPRPHIKGIAIERLKSIVVDGRTLESLYMKGRPLKILAQNISSGGSLEIFDCAVSKPVFFAPQVPFAAGSGVAPTSDKESWYVRLKGGELHKVPSGDKAFAELMATMFADCPELAARVRAQEKEASYEFMPRLVREYNAYFESKK